MKFLKILLVILVALTAVISIGGLFLPNIYTVSRSTIINAPDSVVYNNVSSFHNFLKWNPWNRMEPSAQFEISGDIGMPGHMYRWEGKELGKGRMQIQEVKPYSDIDLQLSFEEREAQNHFSFERVPEGTRVTWTMQDQSDAVLDKWMYLNMDNFIGKDFEDGLQNLKELSEQNRLTKVLIN